MLTPQCLAVLSDLILDGNVARIAPSHGQLDRPLYEEVNEVLTRLCGKWDKRKKAHLFPYPVETLLEAVCESGEMPPKNPTAFFPTPLPVVENLLDAVGVTDYWDEMRILEPSAGTGAIAKAIRSRCPGAIVDCCEVLDVNRRVLASEGFRVVAGDFESYQPAEPYDAVIMNPPFSLEGDKLAYVTHCLRAWELLKPGGRFGAIVPPGWLYGSSKKVVEFRAFVCDWLSFEEVGAGAFSESGTEVNTYLIYGSKSEPRTEPFSGWNSYHAWNASLWIDNDEPLYRRAIGAKSVEEFAVLCAEAERQLIKGNCLPVKLREADVAELWAYYTEAQ